MSVPVRSPGEVSLPVELRDALRQRASGELALPVLPDTAARVLAACRDENTGPADIQDLIAGDQTLATHLLRVANSAQHAARVPILSIAQAVGRVGVAMVGDIAIAIVLRERVFTVPGHDQTIRALWRHSAATACFAKEIASLRRRDTETAFLCGLLHDVGMPMVMQLVCDLERQGAVPPVTKPVMEAAMDEFHCEFGARMADSWHLGPWIRLVILHHHEPERTHYHPDEVPVVALADALGDWALDPSRTEEAHGADPRLCEALRFHEGDLTTLLRRRTRVLQAVQEFS